MTIELVNKATQRVLDYHVDSLDRADCYQATNVRDRNTWVLVGVGIPRLIARDWQAGDDGALERYQPLTPEAMGL
jgi:hypothetical protein